MTPGPFPFVTVTTIFLFGAVVGSFLNVCISRIPAGESIIRPPSNCPQCKALIPFYCNIPLLSYLFLRGRCRACGESISLRYFGVEILTGLLAVALLHQLGVGLAFVLGFVFISALIVISFIDLDVRIVPDVISLPGIALGFVFSLAGYFSGSTDDLIPSPLSSLIGILAGGGFLLATACLYERITGVEGMGGGDIKLLAMIGAFLGWPSIPLTLFLSSLAGAVVGVGFMLVKGVDRRFALPFAPFLCLGAVVYLFFGRDVMELYQFPR